jgi:Flp pilus assembly pilin Flp
MKQIIAKFIADEQGQDIIEYALVGSFVSLASYAGASALGTAYDQWFKDIKTAVGKGSAKALAVQ